MECGGLVFKNDIIINYRGSPLKDNKNDIIAY